MNTGMTEKDLMQDLLATEKQVISAYSTGITESSCQNLRNTLMTPTWLMKSWMNYTVYVLSRRTSDHFPQLNN